MAAKLGGKATGPMVRAALAWSRFPDFIPAALWLIFFFQAHATLKWQPGQQLIYTLAAIVSWFWALCIGCQAMGEVNGFSSLKGLWALVLGNALAIILVMIISFAIVLGVPGAPQKIHEFRRKFPNWTSIYSAGPMDPDYYSEELYGPLPTPKPGIEIAKLPDALQAKLDDILESKTPAVLILKDGSSERGMVMVDDGKQIYIEGEDKTMKSIMKKELVEIR